MVFLNVKNLFSSLGARGAESEVELVRQLAKLSASLVSVSADVVALAEVERDLEEPQTLNRLLGALNHPDAEWARVTDPPWLGVDATRVALLYRVGRVRPLGPASSAQDAVFARVPLAQTFEFEGRHRFSVIAAHFKSRGGCPDDPSHPDADHGSGCYDGRRRAEAQALVSFANEAQGAMAAQVVVGDLNSDLGEAPLAILESHFHHALLGLEASSLYSYRFDGRAMLLDHALVRGPLRVVGSSIWHINADESAALDARDERNFAPDPFRSSDHDMLVLDLESSG